MSAAMALMPWRLDGETLLSRNPACFDRHNLDSNYRMSRVVSSRRSVITAQAKFSAAQHLSQLVRLVDWDSIKAWEFSHSCECWTSYQCDIGTALFTCRQCLYDGAKSLKYRRHMWSTQMPRAWLALVSLCAGRAHVWLI